MRNGNRIAAVLLAVALGLCGCGKDVSGMDGQRNPLGEGQAGGNDQVTGQQNGGQTDGSGQQNAGEKNGTAQADGTGEHGGASVQTEMKGEISVACLYEEEFLATAAERFMEKYPDVTVTINSYEDASGGGAAAVENYLSSLNTKIMAGKAEDIIRTCYLPITKYSEMGVFEDLSPYIAAAPEMNEEQYFMNVLQAAGKEDGGLYIVPYKASFSALEFNGSLLAEHPELEKELQGRRSICFSDALKLAERMLEGTEKENAFLLQGTETGCVDYLVGDRLSEFIDMENKEVHLDSEAYIELLKWIKELSGKGCFDTEGMDYYNMEYYFALIRDFDVQAAYYCLDERADMEYGMPVADAEGNIAISATPCLALNSASEKKGLAWEFMRYLLSEEVQSLPSIYGLAVNRKGFEAAVERQYQLYQDGSGGKVDQEAYRNLLESWMSMMNDCDTLDYTVTALIGEETEKFFKGEQTAEETAKACQKKVTQYFNE